VLSRTLECLLADEGFVDEPVGGCPVGDAARGDVDPAQVRRIIDTVVAELTRRGLA
jgi:4-hydroxy-tetrahydrodipicolinate synthase